jgi:hypothetical protein
MSKPSLHAACRHIQASRNTLAPWGLILFVGILGGCASQKPYKPESAFEQVGLANYYAHKFNGQRTASGERYDDAP